MRNTKHSKGSTLVKSTLSTAVSTLMLICSISYAESSVSRLSLPNTTKEKIQNMSFNEFVNDWTFFWSSQPVDAGLDNSVHVIYQLDGDDYLSETVSDDLNSGFRNYCTAHGGKADASSYNLYPSRFYGLTCKTSNPKFNGYVKYQIKRQGNQMYVDIWFVPELDYIDSEKVASRDRDYRIRWLPK